MNQFRTTDPPDWMDDSELGTLRGALFVLIERLGGSVEITAHELLAADQKLLSIQPSLGRDLIRLVVHNP